MLLVCRCGFTKSAHPYKSAATKRMLCEVCKKKVSVILVGKTRFVIELKSPRDGTGRHTALKMPRR